MIETHTKDWLRKAYHTNLMALSMFPARVVELVQSCVSV